MPLKGGAWGTMDNRMITAGQAELGSASSAARFGQMILPISAALAGQDALFSAFFWFPLLSIVLKGFFGACSLDILPVTAQ